MSDPSGPKKSAIPQWQQESNLDPLEKPSSEATSSETTRDTAPPQPRAALLEQASKFLTEDEIRDAPIEKKVAFLETKGLTQEEIHRLLDMPSGRATTGTQQSGTDQTPRMSTPQASQDEPAPTSPPSQSSTKSDVPPIITYPEFLLHSQKPPPLITASRLANTFYLFSGTAAAIYGTSNYIVNPMLDSLTSARHSLFDTAHSNLDTLNEKLQQNVSTVPKGGAEHSAVDEQDDDNESDTTEDITPLFNRTIGTQTSPPFSPSSSTSTSEQASPPNPILMHESSLRSLHSSLSSLLPPSSAKGTPTDPSSQLNDLKKYLNDLPYPSLHAPTTRSAEPKDDAVNKFKAEIRGVKGVLLSARNFPSGTGRGVG